MHLHPIKLLIRPLLIVLSLLAFLGMQAQEKKSEVKRFYLQGGIGIATNNGAYTDLALQAVTSRKFVATLSYTKVDMDAKNIPSDYVPGYVILLFIPLVENPGVTTTVVSATVGKEFKTGR